MGSIASFFAELRRRKVWLVAGIYVVAAWLIIQVTAVVETPLSLPGWFDTAVIVLAIAGLPLALILAWAQETQAAGSAAKVETDIELDPKAVAVLPFENLSPDPDNAYFAAGVHEEVLNQLAKIRDLRIIARTSVLQYPESKKTMPEIAAELGVGSIMEGSVRYAGDRVRITAQLIDGATNSHIWSETYDRNFDDIFSIQSEISLAIAAQLRASLSQEESDAIAKRPTENLEAYNELLRGNAILDRLSADSLEEAVAHFDRAIELDPGFALAYARKAGFTILARSLFGLVIGEDTTEVGLATADKALSLDPLLRDAHWAKAHALAVQCKWDEAITSFRRSIELGPGNSDAYLALAVHLVNMGRADDAVPWMERGLVMDPNNALLHGFAAHVWTQAFARNGQIPRDTYPRISLMPLRSDPRFQALMAKNGLKLDAD